MRVPIKLRPGMHLLLRTNTQLDTRTYKRRSSEPLSSKKNALGIQPLPCATERLSQYGTQTTGAVDSPLRGLAIRRSILVFNVVLSQDFQRCENTSDAEAKEEFNNQTNGFIL